jgi:hypothetical protein
MSGGAGGIVIIEDGTQQTHLEVYLNNSVSDEVKNELHAIQDRSVVHISLADKLRLFLLLWNLLH